MHKFIGILMILPLLSLALSACDDGASTEPTEASMPEQTEGSMQITTEPAESTADPSELLTRLHWLGQASFRLDGPPTIYFDPVSEFINEPPLADIILITHDHSDHYDAYTLKRIATADTVILTTPAIASKLAQDGILGNVTQMMPGDSTTVGEIQIEAVPAYNLDKRYHPKEAGNLGFILTMDGVRVYHAGDTDVIPEMAGFHPDVALIPVGGTYTMNPQQAVEAVAMLQPLVVVPMHILAQSNLDAFQDLCKECTVYVLEPEE
jgi:L-ascorbate metabolism protein UlaG (beta-lactamase superfamily)